MLFCVRSRLCCVRPDLLNASYVDLVNCDKYVIMITLCNVTKSDCAVYTLYPVLELVLVRHCIQTTKSSQVK
jgi:hypothetical protein